MSNIYRLLPTAEDRLELENLSNKFKESYMKLSKKLSDGMNIEQVLDSVMHEESDLIFDSAIYLRDRGAGADLNARNFTAGVFVRRGSVHLRDFVIECMPCELQGYRILEFYTYKGEWFFAQYEPQ